MAVPDSSLQGILAEAFSSRTFSRSPFASSPSPPEDQAKIASSKTTRFASGCTSSCRNFTRPRLVFAATLPPCLRGRTSPSRSEDKLCLALRSESLASVKRRSLALFGPRELTLDRFLKTANAKVETTPDLLLRAEDGGGGVSCEIFTPTVAII
jgi:hypothetical protein